MKRFLRLLGNIGIMILAFLAYGVVQSLYVVRQGTRLPLWHQAVIALATVFIFWAFFAIYKHQLKEENNWNFNEKPHWSIRRILIAVGAFVLIVIMQIIFMKYFGGHATSANQEAIEKLQSQTSKVFNIMLVILAPVCEELIFRGMFFNTFFPVEKIYTKWLGIITSGFVFAFGHDPAMDKFLFLYWMMGSILAWTYVKTKDIRYSILAHMLNNLLSLL